MGGQSLPQQADAVAAAVHPVPLVPTVINILTTVNGKLALITGGSSGIGLALAKLLVSQQCNVGILSRDQTRLENAASEIRGISRFEYIKVSTIQADVSDFQNVSQAITRWVDEHGLPDIIINSAGVSRPGLFQDIELEKFHWMMNTNYFGSIHTSRVLLPKMLSRGSGHMIYVSSVAGFLGMVGYTAYAPTKFAIKGFVDSLRTEIATSGIKLSIVFPPDTETPSLEAERQFQPPLLIAMNENSPPVSAESVASNILKGIKKNHYIITPGSDATLFFQLVGLFGGGLMYPILDLFLADARRKVTRNQSRYSNQNVSNPNERGH
jgi:3-dehydrosphinganine reductase